MTLYRCFPWNARSAHDEPDGPLWISRPYQGGGRHDNPDLYGCLYLSEHPVASVVELLAPFRNHRIAPSLLQQRGLPLALAAIAASERLDLIDLDDPAILMREQLRPSEVATRIRLVTQPRTRVLYERHRSADGLRWWSTFEASWINITLFDRAVPLLRVQEVRALTVDDPTVSEAAAILGLS